MRNDKLDLIDAYQFTVEGVSLFGDADIFIEKMGLPYKAAVFKKAKPFKEFTINTKNDIYSIWNDYDENVHYFFQGIDMYLLKDNFFIPMAIDFSEMKYDILYQSIIFNDKYTLSQFNEHFPKSYAFEKIDPLRNAPSFFWMRTDKKGEEYKHFSLERFSKENNSAYPKIEFTFENGNLIYIIFMNAIDFSGFIK